MKEKKMDPIIKAVQSLRKLALDVKNSNEEIIANDHEVKLNIECAGKLITTLDDTIVTNKWINKKYEVLKNSDKLLELLKEIETKFRNKDATKLLILWEEHYKYKETALNGLNEMRKIGEVVFVDDKLNDWQKMWDNISRNLNNILAISETYKLKFEMMEKLKPEEIDTLTYSILKHIPVSYSDEEADNYKEEYVKAYNELKEEQSKKKNLWDKILDILAGGIVETPEHRVQMRRWAAGEIN